VTETIKYIEKFKLSLLSIEEYCEAVTKLEKKARQPSCECSGTFNWDAGDELPLDVPDL